LKRIDEEGAIKMIKIESMMPVQETTSISPWLAWRNALGITLLGCVIVGLGNFVLAANYFARTTSLINGALRLSVCFTVSFAFILGLIVLRQRRHGESLAELGWLKPTRPIAVILSVVLGLIWVAFSYSGASYLLPDMDFLELSWIRLIMAVLGIFISTAEEIMMRGFFMTQLQRGGIPAWIQIIASGACSAVYHSLHNFSLMSFLPSFILFTSMAGIYVLGRRSITSTAIGHSLIHVLGDPYLIMLILATTH
jgi:membrane protease YdiL (CAAX protease family)